MRALSDVDGDGFIEAQCNGKVGLVPIEHLEPIPNRTPVNGHAGAYSRHVCAFVLLPLPHLSVCNERNVLFLSLLRMLAVLCSVTLI